MGIKRCPYCRALVEEGALYCRNCGTQLLFPEDENIEEDIPGDKIVLDSEEEAEEEIIFEEEKEEAKIDEESFREGELEELSEEEEMESDQNQFRRRKAKDKSREEMAIEEELTDHEEEVETLLEEEGEEIETQQKPTQPTFDFPTAELERLTRSVDEGQKKVEDFLEFLKEKAADRQPDETFAAIKKKEIKKTETILMEETELPPWAEAIRDRVETEVSPSTEASLETAQGYSFEAEKESSFQKIEETISTSDERDLAKSRQPWQTDSGVGLPEKPGQPPLPFETELKIKKQSWKGEEEEPEMMEETKSSLRAERIKSKSREMEEAESEEEIFEEEKADLSGEEKARSRPFLNWLKAKIFDLLFVGLLWFIAFVLAARIVAQPFLALVGASAYQAGAFYLLLFGGYLFLFRFFIGETLGDRLFSPGD